MQLNQKYLARRLDADTVVNLIQLSSKVEQPVHVSDQSHHFALESTAQPCDIGRRFRLSYVSIHISSADHAPVNFKPTSRSTFRISIHL